MTCRSSALQNAKETAKETVDPSPLYWTFTVVEVSDMAFPMKKPGFRRAVVIANPEAVRKSSLFGLCRRQFRG
jgi:hypothetical protein